jgi:hypothetical protein
MFKGHIHEIILTPEENCSIVIERSESKAGWEGLGEELNQMGFDIGYWTLKSLVKTRQNFYEFTYIPRLLDVNDVGKLLTDSFVKFSHADKVWLDWYCVDVFRCPACSSEGLLEGFNFCPFCGIKVQYVKE